MQTKEPTLEYVTNNWIDSQIESGTNELLNNAQQKIFHDNPLTLAHKLANAMREDARSDCPQFKRWFDCAMTIFTDDKPQQKNIFSQIGDLYDTFCHNSKHAPNKQEEHVVPNLIFWIKRLIFFSFSVAFLIYFYSNAKMDDQPMPTPGLPDPQNTETQLSIPHQVVAHAKNVLEYAGMFTIVLFKRITTPFDDKKDPKSVMFTRKVDSVMIGSSAASAQLATHKLYSVIKSLIAKQKNNTSISNQAFGFVQNTIVLACMVFMAMSVIVD